MNNGIPTDFAVEVKLSQFTASSSVRAAVQGAKSWVSGRMSLNGEYVVLVTDDSKQEIKPYRLSWRSPSEFLVSGTTRALVIGRVVVRLHSETEAKQAASAIMASGRVIEGPIYPVVEQVAVEIRATVLVGPLLLSFLFLPVTQFLLVLFVNYLISNEIFGWIYTIGYLVAFYLILRSIWDRNIRAGPVRAWFRPRLVKASVYTDEEDLVIDVKGTPEAYRPTRIDWIDNDSFKVTEGETQFQLIFRTPEEAVKIASTITISPPDH